MTAGTNHPTRDQLLDSAELLFATNGIQATSVRDITRAAGANLASINYHFGSKEGLVRAVVARRIEPINRERYALLDAALARPHVTLRRIVHAFVEPAIRMLMANPEEGQNFVRLMGRIHMGPGEMTESIVLEHFAELIERFTDAMELALPSLDRSEIYWRFHFAIGAFSQTISCGHLLETFTEGACLANDPDELTDRLVDFIVGGFRAGAGRGKRGGA